MYAMAYLCHGNATIVIGNDAGTWGNNWVHKMYDTVENREYRQNTGKSFHRWQCRYRYCDDKCTGQRYLSVGESPEQGAVRQTWKRGEREMCKWIDVDRVWRECRGTDTMYKHTIDRYLAMLSVQWCKIKINNIKKNHAETQACVGGGRVCV